MDEKDEVFRIDFEDVAVYLFESLVRLGYVPEADEILDLTDVVMDLFANLHEALGGKVVIVSEEIELDGEDY